MPGFCGFTTANQILDLLYRGTPIAINTSLWLRLLVSPSSRSGGGTETNYGGYARFEIDRDASPFGVAAVGGQLNNTTQLIFPIATTVGNGDLNSFDIVDTASGAFTKLYNGGPIVPPKAVIVGRAPTFDIGKLIMTF